MILDIMLLSTSVPAEKLHRYTCVPSYGAVMSCWRQTGQVKPDMACSFCESRAVKMALMSGRFHARSTGSWSPVVIHESGESHESVLSSARKKGPCHCCWGFMA